MFVSEPPLNVKPDQAWFKDGLKFTCTQCGKCCTGAPGFVWVNDAEIKALAERVNETVSNFERIYVRNVGNRRSLNELEDGSCVFFRHNYGCTVYEHRPRQCRTWPFWDSNIETQESWKQTCEICPGSGRGELHTVESIIEKSKLIVI
jgi:hypothetical protein